MTVDDLRQHIQEIALRDPLEHKTALNELKTEARNDGFDVDMRTLRQELAVYTTNNTEQMASDVVTRINEDWFLVGGEGSLRFARWEGKELRFYKRQDFAGFVAPLTALAMGQAPDVVYMRSNDRRLYSGITIDNKAGEVVGDKVNLWRGYGVEEHSGDEGPFVEYLQATFGEDWTYVLNWCAYTIQNPCERANVILFLISQEEGTGKSTLGRIMRTLFGHHARKATKAADVTGRFTDHLAGALFVHGDEIMFAGDKAGADSLKTLATDDTMRVEPKGVPSFETENRLSFLMTSNHEHAAHIGSSDRRYAMVRALTANKGNTEYWDGLNSWLEDGGFEIVLKYLLDIDLDGFNIVNDRPISDLHLTNKRQSMQSTGKWWSQCISQRKIVGAPIGMSADEWIDKSLFYGWFVKWAERNDRYNIPNDKVFWRDMRAICEKAEFQKPMGKPRQVKIPDWDDAEADLIKYLS